ncbi:hypothetical protein COLO4_08356 [Corchorus olitorius]|uniref:Uncharacterized protein n=1 Tax=Corchorus olitorius TaxID=93759 RepID=A0A1R3KG77_9ROSI|nr:hypothetical protein COLO4_08356 [Corchorus olitorius]
MPWVTNISVDDDSEGKLWVGESEHEIVEDVTATKGNEVEDYFLKETKTELEDSSILHSFLGKVDQDNNVIQGKVVVKFCSKYLHQQVLKHEAYAAGDI